MVAYERPRRIKPTAPQSEIDARWDPVLADHAEQIARWRSGSAPEDPETDAEPAR